jgi:hypothetical protein
VGLERGVQSKVNVVLLVDTGLHINKYCKSIGKRYETLLSSEITYAVKSLHLLVVPMSLLSVLKELRGWYYWS